MYIRFFISILAVALAACTSMQKINSHTNLPQLNPNSEHTRATFNVNPKDRGRGDTLFILAFSGGGSRAAYWSADVMLKLEQVYASQDMNLLQEVDAISSVSGGSLPAAYYAISTDPGDPPLYGKVWDEDTVKRQMSKNYTRRWFGNWFWPYNIARYYTTGYDRTDIMAQTLADNLYDTKLLGRDLRMRDLNPARPYLILNATNGTRGAAFGSPFTFTAEDFALIGSDIDDYEVARAVMGTAAFPGVFSYMTLENYRTTTDAKPQYVHIFDGGNVDNLGLSGVSRILKTLNDKGTPYDRLIVILVDAYAGKSGVSNDDADSRKPLDFIVDSNFIDATDSLLSENRSQHLSKFENTFMQRLSEHPELTGKAVFYHIQFTDSPKYKDDLWKIPTNFSINTRNRDLIDKAADELLTPENTCLMAIRDILAGGSYAGNPICHYQL